MLNFLTNGFLPIALVIILSIVLLAWLLRLLTFFWYRYRNKDKPNPHENKETLGLPKGAIRTFLTLAFTSVALIAMLGGDSVIAPEDKKWILGELGIVITFYFGSRAVESFVESRARLKAIEKISDQNQLLEIYLNENKTNETTPIEKVASTSPQNGKTT